MHFILPKYYKDDGSGLLAQLQNPREENRLSHLNHSDFFHKYLLDPENILVLEKSVRKSCEYLWPHVLFTIRTVFVNHLTGINNVARQTINNNTNQIFVVFEYFSDRSVSKSGSSGHFMIMWNFPSIFPKSMKDKFCLFDSLGRQRINDPEEFYFHLNQEKGEYKIYQSPETETCAMWCIYALWNYCLRKIKFYNIEPVNYNGKEKELGTKTFDMRHGKELLNNDKQLLVQLMNNSVIFRTKDVKNYNFNG